jgi:hypothetical protein
MAAGRTERRYTDDERGTGDAAMGRARGRYDHQGGEMTEVLDPQMQAMLEAARPRKEHDWLHKLIGEWEYETVSEEPGKPPTKSVGTERVRSIGGIWIVGEGEGEMPGGAGPATTLLTLGYDPQKGRFVGTWIGSMMPNLWVYDGFLDAAERVLTLESEGPSFTNPGALGKYRDIITIVDDDYHTLTAKFLGDDGTWNEMMTMHFRRKK